VWCAQPTLPAAAVLLANVFWFCKQAMMLRDYKEKPT